MLFADRLILVLGATGQQGGSVARALRSAGWPVRALVRNAGSASARSLAELGCTLVVGDQADRGSIERAVAGAYGVFSVQPSSGQSTSDVTDDDEIAYAVTVAEAARGAGVKHFVQTSMIAVGMGPMGLPHFDSKADIEERLRALDLPLTIVRPATFMELLTQPGLGLEQGRLTFLMRPGQSIQFIAVADIGRIVAAVFADLDRFVGQAIPIASDEVTGEQLAAALGGAAGRPVRYERFPDAVLEQNALLRGAAALFDDGRLAGNADLQLLRALVPELYRFDDWLRGPGRPGLEIALNGEAAEVALR